MGGRGGGGVLEHFKNENENGNYMEVMLRKLCWILPSREVLVQGAWLTGRFFFFSVPITMITLIFMHFRMFLAP